MLCRKQAQIFSIALLVGLSVASQAQTNDQLVAAFAQEIRGLVADSDVAAFLQVRCVPQPCTNSEFALQLIFDTPEIITHFERIMRDSSLEIRIIGPYTREEPWPDATYTVIYYDPGNSPFGDDEKISPETGEKELYKTFLQTEVTLLKGMVHFHRVPFHLEAHHPYVGDYG